MAEYSFLAGGGAVGALMRARRWTDTPLGPIETWPQSLRSMLSALLNSPILGAVLWGPDLLFLYNDAYIPSLADRHPSALGRPVSEVWGAAWTEVSPPFYQCLATGEGFERHGVELAMVRNGAPETTYWDFSAAPIRGEDGSIVGLLNQGVETTSQILRERLHAAESERQRKLLAQMPGFVSVLSGPDHVYRYVNDACLTIASPRTLIGRSVRDVFPELAGQGFFEVLDEVYATGLPIASESMAIRLAGDSEDRFVDHVCQPIRNDQHAVTGVFVCGYDITERIRAEHYRDALIRLTDRIGDLAEPSEIECAAARILGEALKAAWVGYGAIDSESGTLHVERDWHAPDPALREPDAIIDRLARGDVVSVREIDLGMHVAGRETPESGRTQRSVTFPMIEQGRPVAALFIDNGTVRDWSPDALSFIREAAIRMRIAAERSRNDAALRDLNATLEARIEQRSAALQLHENIIQSDDTAICAFDTDFRLIAFNKAHNDEFFRVNGFMTKIGDVFCDLFVPQQQPVMRAQMARALRGESFTIEEEFGNPAIDAPRWEIRYSPLRDAAGNVVGAFHHARDISARLRAQSELADAQHALRQSQKMEAMGQLTGGVAHDFNNLLTPIVGVLDMLQRKQLGGEREQRLIDGAVVSAERARTLVQRLLAFARRQPLRTVAVDIGQLVTGMAELVTSTTGPQIRVVVDVPAELPAANADPNQLEMALLNLAVNARDAMIDGGTLRISASAETVDRDGGGELKPGRYVRLSVADTGIGMSEDILAHAIEPFFSTKGVGKGTGLGLSMAHGLASQLGGVLRLSSRPGLGTNVELWLPESADRVETPREVQDVALSPKRGTALLVDDEDYVRLSTADMLADLGFDVVEAASAEAALALVARGVKPDLLVTDHLMPGMTGSNLARAIRAEHASLPVLVISGYAESEGIQPDLPRLTKPFRRDELIGSLAALGI